MLGAAGAAVDVLCPTEASRPVDAGSAAAVEDVDGEAWFGSPAGLAELPHPGAQTANRRVHTSSGRVMNLGRLAVPFGSCPPTSKPRMSTETLTTQVNRRCRSTSTERQLGRC